jgi:hydroxylamine reductase
MHMFCFQCQETSSGKGCTFGGHCGKTEETANLQDLLIYSMKALATVLAARRKLGRPVPPDAAKLIFSCLYSTITNTNFDADRITLLVTRILEAKRAALAELPDADRGALPPSATWDETDPSALVARAYTVGVLLTPDENVRSLRETVTYGLKGLSAYAHHAALMNRYLPELGDFVVTALATISHETDLDRLFELALQTGKANLTSMALLDGAHQEAYGTPEFREVPVGVRGRPGILVSGHDLGELHELLEQTQGLDIDVYTHGEMVSAHYYPFFRRYPQLAGNYGASWWVQDVEFERFRGPVLVTTNCIVPVQDSYKDRIFTTGLAGYPGVPHLAARRPDGLRDYSALIELARTAPVPDELERGSFAGGYQHAPLLGAAEQILDLVARGKVRRFLVMAGCDGRDRSRSYYRDLALALPKDVVILTAGCAKYVFCKLPLGDIEGLPRVLDAGQCGDCYSLAYFALKLKERLGLADINELPVSYQVCWYDQKAVAVFLTLLHLGVKNVWLGPTFPAFFSKQIVEKLKREFGMRAITSVEADLPALLP